VGLKKLPLAMPSRRRKACKAVKLKFRESDRSGDGRLDYNELAALLRKGDPRIQDAEIRRLFGKIDQNHDGRIDFAEFCDYIFEQEGYAAKRAPPEVEATFDVFSGFRDQMAMSGFAKLCKDCYLHNSDFKPGDAGIIFSQVKPRGAREIGLDEFLEALELLAEKRKCEVSEVHKAITIAYEQAAANGGWTSVSLKEADTFRSKSTGKKREGHGLSETAPARLTTDEKRTGLLLDVFLQHSSDPHGGMELDMLIICLEDAGLLHHGISEADVISKWDELVNTLDHRGRAAGAKMSFADFSQVLDWISSKLKCPYAEVEKKVAALRR